LIRCDPSAPLVRFIDEATVALTWFRREQATSVAGIVPDSGLFL